MRATEPTTSFLSSSVVLFQHTFIRDLFFKNRGGVRRNFRFLLEDRCIADLLANGYTDLNLSDGRFWDRADCLGDVLSAVIPDFSSPSEVTPDSTRRYELRHCRDPKSLRELGVSVKQLMDIFHPGWPVLTQPFVPHLGPLKICRNAIMNVRRSTTYTHVSSFLPRSLQPGYMVTDFEEQSITHFPLAINPKSPIVFSVSDSAAREGSRQADLRIIPTLRVHIYPYGLATVSLILNITASSPFTPSALMSLQEECLNSQPGEPQASISYGRTFRGSVPEFFAWVGDLIVDAVTLGKRSVNRTRSAIHTVTCLRRPYPLMAARERVGLLVRELDWANLSEGYLDSYSSFFGRYTGEFVHATPTQLLFCLGEVERRRKRKSGARFRWNFIAIFQAVSARRLVFEQLETHFLEANSRKAGTGPRVDDHVLRWFKLTDNWHRRLLRPHRKFFYELDRALHLPQLRARMDNYLRDITRAEGEVARRQVEDYILASVGNIHWLLREKEWVYDPDEGERKLVILPESQLEAAALDLHGVIARGLDPVRHEWGPIESRIQALVGGGVFNALSGEAKKSLMSAELLLDFMGPYGDFSASVLEFGKAAELEFNLRLLPPLLALAEQRLGRRAFKVGRRTIGRYDKHSLTLGELPYLFAPTWVGALSERTYVNDLYNTWAKEFFLGLLGYSGKDGEEQLSEIATELQALADYRNKAAHTRSIDKRCALAARQWWSTASNVHALIVGMGASGSGSRTLESSL